MIVATSCIWSAICKSRLVLTEEVPGDRRGVRVVLTNDGRQRYAAALARHREVIEREFGRRLTAA